MTRKAAAGCQLPKGEETKYLTACCQIVQQGCRLTLPLLLLTLWAFMLPQQHSCVNTKQEKKYRAQKLQFYTKA
jgi:hypothetical protein